MTVGAYSRIRSWSEKVKVYPRSDFKDGQPSWCLARGAPLTHSAAASSVAEQTARVPVELAGQPELDDSSRGGHRRPHLLYGELITV